SGFEWDVLQGVKNVDWAFVNSSAVYPDTMLVFYTPGTYTVQLTAKNICGEDTWTTTIQVYEAPSVSIEAPVNDGCNSFVYTPVVQYDGAIASVQWTFEGGSPASSTQQQPGAVSYNQAGIFPVTLQVFGPCDTIYDTVYVIVSTNEPPVFEQVGTLCSNDAPIQLQANIEGGDWSGVGVSSGGIFTPSQADIGSNVIHYVAGPDWCQSVGDLIIEVLQSAVINISATPPICIDAGLLQIQHSPEGGEWMGNGVSPDGIFNPVAAGVGSHPLHYLYQATSQCVTEGDISIEVVGIPSLSIQTFSICEIDQALNLQTLLDPAFQPSGGDLDWSGNGVTDGEAGTFNPSVAGLGVHTLTATYTVPPGCDTSITFTIEITPFVQANTGADDSACQSEGTYQLPQVPGGAWTGPCASPNGQVNLSCLTPGTHPFTLTLGGGTLCASSDAMQLTVFGSGANAGNDIYACEDAQTVALPVASPVPGTWLGLALINGNQVDIQSLPFPIAGTYTYYYLASNLPDECKLDSMKLVVHALPTPLFSLPDTGCVNAPVLFTNTSTGATSYFWDFGDGGTSTLPNPSHIYTGTGIFTVTLFARTTTPAGATVCESIATETIYVAAPPPLPVVTAMPDGICTPVCVTFSGQSAGVNVAFAWDFGNGQSANGAGPFQVCYPAGFGGDTTYTVALSTPAFCGENGVSYLVEVRDRPRAVIGYSHLTACSGEFVHASNQSTNHPDSSAWFLNGEPLPLL
ncbi:MAG: PKD domain-containing protein, partial [Actinomycetota bacterium]